MREVKLELISNNPQEIQELIFEQFQFPEYYGKNLDAFHDCLCEIKDETMVEVILDETDAYHKKVLRVLNDVSEENDNIHVIVVSE